MLRKSFMILALSAFPAALSAQTDEEAYAAAVRAGACSPEGIARASYQPDGRVAVVCNQAGGISPAAGAIVVVLLLAAAGGGGNGTSTTTTTFVPDS
jgi:hypothetical protein